MSLADKHTGVMDRLGESELEHLSLKTTFQEIFQLQTKNVIELHLGFIKYSNTDQSTKQSVTCNETFSNVQFYPKRHVLYNVPL